MKIYDKIVQSDEYIIYDGNNAEEVFNFCKEVPEWIRYYEDFNEERGKKCLHIEPTQVIVRELIVFEGEKLVKYYRYLDKWGHRKIFLGIQIENCKDWLQK